MQLFITEYKKQGTTVIISNPEILLQVRKVLRANIGDSIRIQDPTHEEKKTRYEIYIEKRNNKDIQGKILSEHIHESTPETKSMIIAMPNKWDKAELIVQKLSEIAIDKIIFWPSERSVIKQWNSKKEERLQKIIKEAVEQSRGRKLPELAFSTTLSQELQNKDIIIFDKSVSKDITPPNPPHGMERAQLLDPSLRIGEGVGGEVTTITGIIGPEGGLTPRDYQTFAGTKYTIYGLGETVLRMETAAIIGAWLLKNNFEYGMLNFT